VSRVLVVGGTGLCGRQVTLEAVRRGHEVSVASRRVPADGDPAYVAGVRYVMADLVSAHGLEAALDLNDVLIDTTNGMGRSSSTLLTVGALNLLHAAARWGIGHAVLLSIINVDKSNYSYYRAKAAQEQIYRESALETRIVRTTQFHDLVTSFFERGARFGLIPALSGVRFQTIATADVARILVDAATGVGEPDATETFGGPQVLTTRQMAEEWKRGTRRRGLIVPAPVPGSLGRLWKSGGNLAPDRAAGTISYADWLTSRA
jgi:uncharacterized protein YbjT (DUF2867 family)